MSVLTQMTKLRLKSLFSHENLSIRSSISNIAQRISQDTPSHLQLDFDGIQFISRACAHEIIVLIKNVESTTNAKIELVGVDSDVQLMLDTVHHSLNKNTVVYTNSVRSIPRMSLKEFLVSGIKPPAHSS